jgi:hypothetical protein
MKKILFIGLIIAIVATAGICFAATVNQLRGVNVEDLPGKQMIGLNMPEYVDAIVLVANTAQNYTIPSGAKYLMFSANDDFYVNWGTTAAVPSASTATGAAAELNPGLRSVKSGTATISLIGPRACTVTVLVYK